MFEITNLLEAADVVNSHLRAQAAVQQDIPAALVQLVQTEFNESFRQVFTSHLPVCWPHFTPLILKLTKGHFPPVTVTMPGGSVLAPQTPPHHQGQQPHPSRHKRQRNVEETVGE